MQNANLFVKQKLLNEAKVGIIPIIKNATLLGSGKVIVGLLFIGRVN
jgi:hypothetical protein